MGWLTILTFLSILSLTAAEPAQYCRHGTPSEIDFCMGVQMYRNQTTSSHDLFLTLTVNRHAGSAHGWTAIGAGEIMQSSLMFIVYGDPLSKQQPLVSIRTTASGHHQPQLLTQSSLPRGMDLRVVSSLWSPSAPFPNTQGTHTATVYLICYSCSLWNPSPSLSSPSQNQNPIISPESNSQPFIWAWNPSQKFQTYTFDAHLDMHKHHAGAGGWGNFYVDLQSTISTARAPPSLPPIRPGVSRLGTSDTPIGFSTSSILSFAVGPGSFLHGLILATAFLVLFPVGVFGIRSGSSRAYAFHWVVQVVASGLLLLGMVLGLMKKKGGKIDSLHQMVGIGIVSVIGLQGFFGWWHHVRLVGLRGRTWVSHVHIWLGRGVLVMGWGNVVSGLLLRGYTRGSFPVVGSGVVVGLEAVGLGSWLFLAERKRRKQAAGPTWAKIDDDSAFVVGESDDEEEEGIEKAESESDVLKG